MTLRAPAQKQALLLELVECDLTLSRAQGQREKLPVALGIPGLEATLEQRKQATHEALIDLEAIRAELARAESDVAVVEARIEKDTERLVHTSSAKDAQGLEHELESLRQRRSDLEDIELAVMERIDQAQAALQAAESELAEAESALLAARDQEATTGEALGWEIRQAGEARAAIVADLPAELYELYERQRQRYGQGASHLRGGISSASGVSLTESDLQAIRTADPDEVVLCPDSNAILVRTKESGL